MGKQKRVIIYATMLPTLSLLTLAPERESKTLSVEHTEFLFIFWRTILIWAILCIPYRIHGRRRQNQVGWGCYPGDQFEESQWWVLSLTQLLALPLKPSTQAGWVESGRRQVGKALNWRRRKRGRKVSVVTDSLGWCRIKAEPALKKRLRLQEQRFCFLLLISYQVSLIVEDKKLLGKLAML